MATRSATALLLRDELVGFAKSRVMIVLWIVLPLLAVGGYLLLPDRAIRGIAGGSMSATAFMSVIISSVAGTVAALMVAVDIVAERNRKVYELFVIRPIRREAILWSKVLAVFTCVTVACIVSLGVGIAVDAINGSPPSGEMLHDLVRALVSLVGVLAISVGVGALFGVVSRSILVAVILVLYVGQNLAVVPMLPIYLGVLPDLFWLMMVFSGVLAGVLIYIAGLVFRRIEF